MASRPGRNHPWRGTILNQEERERACLARKNYYAGESVVAAVLCGNTNYRKSIPNQTPTSFSRPICRKLG